MAQSHLQSVFCIYIHRNSTPKTTITMESVVLTTTRDELDITTYHGIFLIWSKQLSLVTQKKTLPNLVHTISMAKSGCVC